MVMFTSDVASVMLGKLSGVAAQLKRDIPHLVQQHCIAHREDLGISDVWKEVKLIRDIETLMRTVHTVFCWSSRRICKFQEIVDASECESVAIRPRNEVSWLSMHFPLRAIIRNYNPLLEYFEQDKDTDPVSKYCHKKLNTMEYRITLEVMKDVLSELASLSTLLRNGPLHLLKHFTLHEVKSLCSKYKDFLAEEIVIISQYNDFKFAVAERIKSQLVLSFPDMVTFAHQNEQFQDLAKLMDIGGTFLASSTDCERGFSLMNTLKNKLWNCLQVDRLDMLMCIKSYQLDGGLIDLDRVYIEWANEKDRREKQKTRFIVHGFMSTGKRGWVVKMCLLLVEVEDVNCIAVDWAEGAKGIYISAVNNIRVVGAEIAYFINTLMKMFRYCPSHIHIIGHSLGAHVAGDAGRRIRGIKRITGLDPAGPLFEGTPPKVRLDPTDARFVDVIHSNAAQFPTVGAGIVNTSGHLDFYPNGGSIMPGCDDVIIPSKKGWSHKISIKLSGTKKVRGELNIVFHGTDRFTKQYQIICGLLHQGNIYTKYVDVEINPRNITKIEFLWNKNIFTLLWAQLGAEMVHVINEEDGHVCLEFGFLHFFCLVQPEEITAINPATIGYSNFNTNKITRFIIHGFIDQGEENWLSDMCKRMFEVEDVNCICIDWSGGSRCQYTQASNNVRVVGAEVAYFINVLMEQYGYSPSKVHFIGHSLGAHAAGETGRRRSGLGRITGLDPAQPYFQGTPIEVRLDKTDAAFVDIIHTDSAPTIPYLGFGMNQAIGHLDFYPNGGIHMPGCKKNPVSQIVDIDGIWEGGCPEMGHYADKFKDRVTSGIQKLYLNTGEAKDFARWRYKVSVSIAGKSKVSGYVNIALYGAGGNTRQYEIVQGTLKPGETYANFIDVELNVGTITKVKFLWNNHVLNPTLPTLGAAAVTVQAGEDGSVFNFCGSETVRENVLQTLTSC
ncbi:unnamed protein product [Caretta caretta]